MNRSSAIFSRCSLQSHAPLRRSVSFLSREAKRSGGGKYESDSGTRSRGPAEKTKKLSWPARERPPRLYCTDGCGFANRIFKTTRRAREQVRTHSRARTRAQPGWPGRGNAAPGYDNFDFEKVELRGSACNLANGPCSRFQ